MSNLEMIGFYETVVETMMDALMVVDADGMIVAVNRATEDLTGYSREELIGSPCAILHCDHCPTRQTSEAFKCPLFETKQLVRRRCNITRKDGTLLPIMKNASVLWGKEGKATGGVETLTNLSELITKDRKIARLSSLLKSKDQPHGIVGKSKIMGDVLDLVAEAAQSQSPIIIYGESGTGKELVAEAVHRLGTRKHGPFVKVNCAALTESLLESELFGHVKGAYTGADRMRKGRFELAHGGDIFLDEIGDIPLSTQVKILRVLQEKEFERVGDSTPVEVDVRIISATHRSLSEMIARNEFREDLFYRLNVIPVRLPPLRERSEDIPLLIEHFMEESRLRSGKDINGISNEAMDGLMSHSWPGNIRELINAIEYAFVVCRQAYIEKCHLPDTIKNKRSWPSQTRGGESERDRIVEAMKRSGGKKAEAARLLGITRQGLWKKAKKLGIKANYGSFE